MKKPKLSQEMLDAVEIAKQNGGKLLRYKGGFWARPNWLGSSGDRWFSTLTIRALINRCVFVESEMKQNGAGSFCVEVSLAEGWQ